ncbi:hypothetical protein [Paenisporosarcina sp. NPDC076898]|uniref:hypothetical protein n=1 Tax=unclassified Paenisporosarcina TaxID=2642018 RepID=UPI003D0656E6
MSNNNWSEQKIDELLSQVPQIHDTRSKDDVFKRLQQDPRLADVKKEKRKQWIPPAVAVAAMVTLTVLVASYINNPQHSEKATSEMGVTEDSADMVKEGAEESTSMMKNTEMEESAPASSQGITSTEKTSAVLVNQDPMLTSAYPADTKDHTVFHIGMVSNDAIVVPLTVLIPTRTIKNDFGDEKPTSLELYNQYAAQIVEPALGFAEYHPYQGQFSEQQNQLIHKLPAEHDYDLSSATINTFDESIMETFYGYSQVVFQNEDGSQAYFDQVGPKKPEQLRSGNTFSSFYLYTNQQGNQFLVPNLNKTHSDIQIAMTEMKTTQSDYLKSVIPEGIDYEVRDEDGTNHIKFTQQLNLEQMDPQAASHLIEGILLTNGSFGEEVQFENIVPLNWKGFDFSKPIPRPIGANKFIWE